MRRPRLPSLYFLFLLRNTPARAPIRSFSLSFSLCAPLQATRPPYPSLSPPGARSGSFSFFTSSLEPSRRLLFRKHVRDLTVASRRVGDVILGGISELSSRGATARNSSSSITDQAERFIFISWDLFSITTYLSYENVLKISSVFDTFV